MAPSQLRGELDLATVDQMEEAIFKFMRRQAGDLCHGCPRVPMLFVEWMSAGSGSHRREE